MGGLALILGFALLCSRRFGIALAWTGAQALMVSVALAAASDLPAAVANVMLSGVLVPFLFSHLQGVLPHPMEDRAALPRTLAAAGVLSVLAAPAGPLALPLAIMLIGLLLVASRRAPSFQGFGLCAMQQAALLAASTGKGDSTALPSLMLAIPVLPALALGSLWLARAEASRP
jgi:hypothetical protein